jgi:hypothetical protein
MLMLSHSEARTMKRIGAGLAILNVAAKSAYGPEADPGLGDRLQNDFPHPLTDTRRLGILDGGPGSLRFGCHPID